MNKIVLAVVALAVAVGGYFFASSSGLLGGAMTAEEVATTLNARAKEINDSDGLKYDDFSQLTAAKVDGMTITVDGKSLLKAANVNDSYLGSRTDQAANKLCNDDASKAMLAAGATFVYNWVTADGEEIGTVTADPKFCDAA